MKWANDYVIYSTNVWIGTKRIGAFKTKLIPEWNFENYDINRERSENILKVESKTTENITLRH